MPASVTTEIIIYRIAITATYRLIPIAVTGNIIRIQHTEGSPQFQEIHHILALHKLLIRNKPCQPNCRRYIPAMIGRQ